MIEQLIPARAVAPGRILNRELKARGWTQKDLAQIMGRPEQVISEIVRAKKRITSETALELADALGGSPQFWMNLEANYRLVMSIQQKKEKGIARRSRLYSMVPVRELLTRGWIKQTKSVDELEKEICSLLGISSPDQKPMLEASFRHSKGREPDRNSVICWVNRVKHLAREQESIRFSRAKLEKAIPGILNHARAVEDVKNVPGLLRNLGVHFVIV
ncbi:HigA family addiction module antidote protein, partial [bacterium]|nr:HigA family addiction module antidote protein [bacterium]